ncbi:pectin acetylesterase-family hydrolase [Rubrivirga sp.]|uniref:pectin acetylesterase-family hydrolase n=1 Tax=Rubrivirga sp. TaxID=1885344 RepID=UPI003B52053B
MSRFRSLAALAGLLLVLPACDSSEPDGPLAEAQANVGQWTFIDVEGSQCRDGSPTGIGLRLQEGADDLVIYLEGGGACFNALTCATNPRSFSEADFNTTVARVGDAGLFSTGADNPVGDYNMVYVPYCTGDVHAGSSPNNSFLQAAGVEGTQQFVGHGNVKRALALLADGLDTPDKVLLAGSSAGGLGVLFNFGATARTFSDSDLFMVDDSGPVVYADNVLSPPFVTQVVQLYNASATLSEAPQLFGPDGFQGIYTYYADTYPDATFGFSSYLGDDVFQGFFGFGQAPGDEITDEEFAASLRDLRGRLSANWATYYAEGDAHTFLLVPSRYNGTSAGVAYSDWLGDILDGRPTAVDPGAAARVPLAAR